MAKAKKLGGFDLRTKVVICISGSYDLPYWAMTKFGPTRGYKTTKELFNTLDFVFGKEGWKEVDRRLADAHGKFADALRIDVA
jgi:hypothetical protein